MPQWYPAWINSFIIENGLLVHVDQPSADISHSIIQAPLDTWCQIAGEWWFVAYDERIQYEQSIRLHRGLINVHDQRYHVWARLTPDGNGLYAIHMDAADKVVT